jgi:hypothetical protein
MLHRDARLVAVIAVITVGPMSYSVAGTPDSALLQAIRLEQKADPERVTATITQSGMADSWVMEKALGRMHVRRQTPSFNSELYLLDNTAYWRFNGGSWIKQPITHPVSVPLNPSVLFTNQLTGVRAGPNEIIGGKAARSYVGSISWMSGGRSCSGELSLAVTVATGLPAALNVKGDCESLPIDIAETFEYGASIQIKSP